MKRWGSYFVVAGRPDLREPARVSAPLSLRESVRSRRGARPAKKIEVRDRQKEDADQKDQENGLADDRKESQEEQRSGMLQTKQLSNGDRFAASPSGKAQTARDWHCFDRRAGAATEVPRLLCGLFCNCGRRDPLDDHGNDAANRLRRCTFGCDRVVGPVDRPSSPS